MSDLNKKLKNVIKCIFSEIYFLKRRLLAKKYINLFKYLAFYFTIALIYYESTGPESLLNQLHDFNNIQIHFLVDIYIYFILYLVIYFVKDLGALVGSVILAISIVIPSYMIFKVSSEFFLEKIIYFLIYTVSMILNLFILFHSIKIFEILNKFILEVVQLVIRFLLDIISISIFLYIILIFNQKFQIIIQKYDKILSDLIILFLYEIILALTYFLVKCLGRKGLK